MNSLSVKHAVLNIFRVLIFSAISLVFGITLAVDAHAQTYTVLHRFSGGADGSFPTSTLLIDRGGNLYGTTQSGGSNGVLFQLKHAGSQWILNTLHNFTDVDGDGAQPVNIGGLIAGPDGAIYGTTQLGGINCITQGNGTVFRMHPSPTVCHSANCPWIQTILYSFTGHADGAWPVYGVSFDPSGSLYATTTSDAFGTAAIKLTQSGGTWEESSVTTQGIGVSNGLISDQAGNLYGTGTEGAVRNGSVFQLQPTGSGWRLSTLHNFTGTDGSHPGGLVMDADGTLFGATSSGGSHGLGTVFEVSPSGSGWVFTTLFNFSQDAEVQSALTLDAQGNLYGTAKTGGAFGSGMVFKLTRSQGGWSFVDLHDFAAGQDGASPYGGVTFDPQGNLYGTTAEGGNCQQCGVVWEITP